MKNLYPKAGKGKIHPSPSPTPSPSDAIDIFALLPVTILALTATLSNEDKQVLAYLITRSVHGDVERKAPRCCGWRSGFECGCFECYTRFWIRWDSSPDRELIHQVIEAFEEHLASKEKVMTGKSGGRRRDRKRNKKMKGSEKIMEEVNVQKQAVKVVIKEKEDIPMDDEKVGVLATETEEEKKIETFEDDLPVGCGSGEKQRSWPDVMGIVNSRLWSLWSPGV
ncbi:hypothetical protein ZOSMA_58G00670 [Zostera marina]|uniref:Uncharacterized protein n=1 Tax=Zostera marina TaxID=29655 RepID=A0A0K9NV38_ZOSMR|nr:hypothetical protein ZOSMA_58G00670 [Zostera marina]